MCPSTMATIGSVGSFNKSPGFTADSDGLVTSAGWGAGCGAALSALDSADLGSGLGCTGSVWAQARLQNMTSAAGSAIARAAGIRRRDNANTMATPTRNAIDSLHGSEAGPGATIVTLRRC